MPLKAWEERTDTSPAAASKHFTVELGETNVDDPTDHLPVSQPTSHPPKQLLLFFARSRHNLLFGNIP